jgi:SP family arabinose:H+ symporter-like MFS transporter
MSDEHRVTETETQGSLGYVVLLVTVAALGGLLFGYDTAVISGAIGFLRTRFGLDEVMTGWAASAALVGCIAGASAAGALSDRVGRKRALLVSAVLFAVSAIGAALPRSLAELVTARIIGGLGIGIASMLSPLYIAEVSPARVRGRMVSVNQFAIISGMLVVYYVNAVVAGMGDETWNVQVGWRWMFGSGVLPAFIFFGLLLFVPESPRWLIKHGDTATARGVLARVNGGRRAAEEIDEIRGALARESGSVRQLFQPSLRVPLLIGIVLAILQQVTGINVVLYYAPEIFKGTGLAAKEAINDTVLVGLVNLVFTIVAIWVVDRAGRKPLLLVASAGMGVALTALGGAFVRHAFEGPWVLLLVLVYVASFAVAMGPVVWVVLSEIFPTDIRGRAMSVATFCLWVACYIVSQSFPVMLKALAGYVFFVYAAMCVVSFLFVAAVVPETKGKTLEEIERGWVAPGSLEAADG